MHSVPQPLRTAQRTQPGVLHTRAALADMAHKRRQHAAFPMVRCRVLGAVEKRPLTPGHRRIRHR